MNILDIAIAKKLAGGGGGSGTDNYNDLSNLPKINDTTLSGNKSSSALGLQSEINSDSKLASDLVDDTNQDNKFVTSTEKNTWNAKQNAIDADHKLSSDLVDDANKTNKFVTSTEKNTWNAKQNAIDSDHKLSSDLVDDANKTNKFVTSTEKNTWNAKQNAIDSDHKLSSSLVSFSTAEAAALASGIDSTKVGQISTNQTNILSVQDATEQLVDDGAKNLFDDNNITEFERLSQSGNVYTATVNDTADKFNLMGYQATPSSVVDRSIYTPNINTNGVVFGVFTKDPSATLLIIGHSGATISNDIRFDISSLVNGEQYVLAINITQYNPQNTLQFKDVMICTKAKYDISPAYEPHALPNTDLTQLQAEDRAALAEVVDSGAKNKFNVSVATAVNGTISNGTFVQDTADAKINLEFKFIALSNGNWVNLLEPRAAITITQNGVRSIEFICPPNVTQLRFGHNGSPNDSVEVINTSSLIAGQAYILQLNILNCVQASGAYSWKDVMICTKAAWYVSQKFVPFTLKQPRTIYLIASPTLSDTETIVTDLNYTIPANVTARITVAQAYNNAIPTAIRIAWDNAMIPSHTYAYVENSNNIGLLSTSVMTTPNTATTLYISAKAAQSGSNNIYMLIELFE